MIEWLGELRNRLRIEDNLRHKADILVHTQLRKDDLVVGVEFSTETLCYSVAKRAIVKHILYPQQAIFRCVVAFVLYATLTLAILLHKVEIDDVGIGTHRLGNNPLYGIGVEPDAREAEKYVEIMSSLKYMKPRAREDESDEDDI